VRSVQLAGAAIQVAILVAAGLFSGAAAAQSTPVPNQVTTSNQVPPAPAGGVDPDKLPDIEGIHLGMTPDVALVKIKTLYGSVGGVKGTINPVPAMYQDAPDPRWLAYVAASISPCGTGACQDVMNATFSGPPNKGVLVGLERSMNFETGKNPTVDSLKTALLQKYGPNPILASTPNTYYWVMNESGGPLVPAPPVKFQDCGATLLAPASYIRAYVPTPPMKQLDLTQWLTLRCHSLGVYVKATIGAQTNSPIALTLDVRITDTAEDMRDALAGERHIEDVNAAAKQKIQKDTEKNVGPL
jgi:hypothetical protein